jgi:hypothetical protein
MTRSILFSRIARLVAGAAAAALLLTGCASTRESPINPGAKPHRFFVGPFGGFDLNFHSGGFTSFTQDAKCGAFTTGSGNGLIAGLAAEYWFKAGGPSSGVQARVSYEQKPGKFDATGTTLFANDTLRKQIIEIYPLHTTDVTYNLLTIETLYKYQFPGTELGVVAGPKFGFPMGATAIQNQTFDYGLGRTPSYVTFDDGSQSHQLYSGDVPNKAGFRLALKIGAQYEFLLGALLVTPCIAYDLGVTKVSSTEGWRVSSLAGTIDFKYGF